MSESDSVNTQRGKGSHDGWFHQAAFSVLKESDVISSPMASFGYLRYDDIEN